MSCPTVHPNDADSENDVPPTQPVAERLAELTEEIEELPERPTRCCLRTKLLLTLTPPAAPPAQSVRRRATGRPANRSGDGDATDCLLCSRAPDATESPRCRMGRRRRSARKRRHHRSDMRHAERPDPSSGELRLKERGRRQGHRLVGEGYCLGGGRPARWYLG